MDQTSNQHLANDLRAVRTEISQMREQNEVIIQLMKEQNELIKKVVCGEDNEDDSNNGDIFRDAFPSSHGTFGNISEDQDSDENEVQKKPHNSKAIPRKLSRFPISTQTELEELENSISETNERDLVISLTSLVMPLGLVKNIKHVLTTEMVMDYNIDGRRNKQRLLDYPKFLNLLFRATYREGWTYDKFLEDLKLGLKNKKQAHYTAMSLKKKKKTLKHMVTSSKSPKQGVVNPLNFGDEEEFISSDNDEWKFDRKSNSSFTRN